MWRYVSFGQVRATLAIVLLGLTVAACGAAGKGANATSRAGSNTRATRNAGRTRASSTAPGQSARKKDADSDYDNKSNGRHDSDDNAILRFGHTASPTERRMVAGIVKRYYAAGAEGDGATACSLIYSIFAEAIPEDYGQAPGPPGLRGKTCAAVLSKFFVQHHGRLAADSETLSVTGVRVEGNRGFALLSFRRMPDRHIVLHRERGHWKLSALLDTGLD